MADREQLKAEIFSLLKDEAKDLWEAEDEAFLKQLAEDVAREKFLASVSPNPKEHEDNLRHLAATLQSRVVEKRLRLNRKGQELFVRILAAVIRAVAMTVLKV